MDNIGNQSLELIVTLLWGTKTPLHYLVMENHLDLKDGSLEPALCFFRQSGRRSKERKEFPERCG